MQKIILGFAAANLLPAAGIVGSMTAAGGGLTTLGLSGGGAIVPEAGLASLSISQLNLIIRGTQKELLNKLFGQGVQGAQRALQTGEIPAGITRQALMA